MKTITRHLYTDDELLRAFNTLPRPLPRHHGLSGGHAFTRSEPPHIAVEKFYQRHGADPQWWGVMGVSQTSSVYVLGPIPSWSPRRRVRGRG